MDDPCGSAVLVSNRQDSPVDEEGLAGLARRVLEGEGAWPAELSVSFVTAEEMAGLHEHLAGAPGPTDVLSFVIGEDDGDGCRVLGDVVVCPQVAAENNPDVAAELRLLLVHGILHLLGHDHESEAKRAEMWARQGLYQEMEVP